MKISNGHAFLQWPNYRFRNLKKLCFSNQKATKTAHMKREKKWFVALKVSSVKQIIMYDRIRKLEIHQFYERVQVPSSTLIALHLAFPVHVMSFRTNVLI